MKAKLIPVGPANELQSYYERTYGKGTYYIFKVTDNNLDNGTEKSILKNDLLMCRIEGEPREACLEKDFNIKGIGIAVAICERKLVFDF